MTISKPAFARRVALALGIFAVAVLSDPSVTVERRSGRAPADLPSLMAVYGADPVGIDRNARDFKFPDQFEWKPRPGNNG